MDIQKELKAHSSNKQTRLIQIYVEPAVSKAITLISQHYKINRSEYIRRCLSLCRAQIRDAKLLKTLDKELNNG
jgi:hypothetical protein